jgi:hypothetical protein
MLPEEPVFLAVDSSNPSSPTLLLQDHLLPELRNGDWLSFPNAGAYTV